MKQKTSIFSLLLLGCFLLASPVLGQPGVVFDLSGENEVPLVDTVAMGSCEGNLNYNETEYRISCENDAIGVTGAHIHNAPSGENGPIIFFFDAGTTFNAVVNESTLDESGNPSVPRTMSEFVSQLQSGELYVNVHTPDNPGGEIRGQIPPAPSILRFAQFGNGDGFSSDIVLLNTASTGDPVTANLFGYSRPGDPLENFEDIFGGSDGEIRVGTHGVGTSVGSTSATTASTNGMGDLILGSVVVVSDGPLDGFIRFNIPGFGSVGVPASTVIDHGLTAARRSGGLSTGLAIVNAEVRDVMVTLSLRTGGVEVDNGSAEFTLVENEGMAMLLHEYFPLADTLEFNGVIVIWADGGVGATAIEVGDGNITALPITPIP